MTAKLKRSFIVSRQIICYQITVWLPEHLAHLRLRLGCALVMHQAAVLGGSALDALTLQQDGLPPAEINISRGQVVQALVVAPVVIVLD